MMLEELRAKLIIKTHLLPEFLPNLEFIEKKEVQGAS
jgi:hypothetical protein